MNTAPPCVRRAVWRVGAPIRSGAAQDSGDAPGSAHPLHPFQGRTYVRDRAISTNAHILYAGLEIIVHRLCKPVCPYIGIFWDSPENAVYTAACA